MITFVNTSAGEAAQAQAAGNPANTPALIREVQRNVTDHDHNTEKLIMIDRNFVTHQSRPLFGPNSALQYFIVNHSSTVRYDGIIGKPSPVTGLQLKINYAVKCNPNTCEQFVKAYALKKAYNEYIEASQMIADEVKDAVYEFQQLPSLSSESYDINKTNLISFVTGRLTNIGLLVVYIEFSFEGEQELDKDMHVQHPSFKAGISDIAQRVTIGFEATIVTDMQQKIKALTHKPDHEMVTQNICDIITGHFQDKVSIASLINNSYDPINNELKRLINKYLESYGRVLKDFDFNIHPQSIDSEKVVEPQQAFPVKMIDHTGFAMLSYTCEVVTDPARKNIACFFADDSVDWEQVITGQIKKTLLEKISIVDFYSSLNFEVAQEIKIAADAALTPWGRKLAYIQMSSDITEKLVEHLEIKHPVACITSNGFTITVEHTLLLKKNGADPRISELSRIPNLEQWCKDKIENITKNFTIQKTYGEVFFDFHGREDHRYGQEIKNLMQAEAASIGYTINQLLIIPEFSDQILPDDRFYLEVSGDDFPSADARVPLSVFITVEGKITSYEKIRSILSPTETLVVKIKNRVREAVRSYLNTVAPDRFYMGFHQAEPGKENDSVENELHNAIKDKIFNDFGILDPAIFVRQKETKLSQRLSQLQEGVFPIEFQSRDGSRKYRSMIEVLYVEPEEGWYRFNARKYKPRKEDPEDLERRDIAKWLKDYIESAIHSRSKNTQGGYVHGYSHAGQMGIRDILDEAQKQICDFFGLKIRLFDPVTLANNEEIYQRRAIDYTNETNLQSIKQAVDLLQIMQKEKTTRLTDLYKKRRDLETKNLALAAPQLEEINRQIKELEDELKNIAPLFNPQAQPLNLTDDSTITEI